MGLCNPHQRQVETDGLETIEKWERDKGVNRLVFENVTFSLTFLYNFERPYFSK